MGIKAFIEEMNQVESGREQFHLSIFFQSEHFYLHFKRLNIKRMYIIKDVLDIILVDGRVLELKVTPDLTYWSKTDLKPEETD